ncbi:MAG: alpha-amylase family glycosyl hydrolase, partial [Planctomycetota bacterium]|nr:alpha-amylase family glycosyl hydrolase [Planctomycetota bacterium]
GRPATFDDVPDSALDRMARFGFEWVWFLGVWQTGEASRQISIDNVRWRQELEESLSDLKDDDISGSPFAIQSYTVHQEFGGNDALARIRSRLRERGIKLLLDFVPNHTGLDHPWLDEHPEFFVHGSEELIETEPQNYIRRETQSGNRIIAHGRDPFFDGWADTLQLNYRHEGFRAAMLETLGQVALECDGVRCDMAMLLLPEVFQGTWGELSAPVDGSESVDAPFWPEAIRCIQRQHPDFIFMAEVYWELESELQDQGFHYTYDKKLYDMLVRQDPHGVYQHLKADIRFHERSVHFLENHDEPRANAAFEPGPHRAAAVTTFFTPGLNFFHDGQLKGRRTKLSMHLGRRPSEPTDTSLLHFYLRLLKCLERDEIRNGEWQLIGCKPAWEDNATFQSFFCYLWEGPKAERLLVVVNYSPVRGQTRVVLPIPEWHGSTIILEDLLGSEWYERDGTEMISDGLYLDLPDWGYNVFQLETT